MEMLLVVLVMTYLQSNYPGGTRAFAAEGGGLTLLPNLILMYLPKEVEFLREKLTAVVAKVGMKIEFATAFNFDGKSNEEIQDIFKDILYRIAEAMPEASFSPVVNPLCLTVTFLDEPALTPQEISTVSEILDGVEGLLRWYLIQKGVIIASKDSTPQPASTTATTVKVVPEQTKRNIPIDGIDVGCLSQALNKCDTVEDFLKAF